MEGMNCLFDFPASHVVIKLFVALNDLPRTLLSETAPARSIKILPFGEVGAACMNKESTEVRALKEQGPIDKFLVAFRTYTCRPGSFDQKAHLHEPLKPEGLFQARKSQNGVVGAHHLPKKAPPLCQDITKSIIHSKDLGFIMLLLQV
ncbi:hypothetical protein RHMOL_Rhmol12G0218200 [Rhododendron molle]|uniref:Uncharacterized protein n=1 Tax=Rhododendron molle TaxID=49168 RepID=A0ACC0LMH0_RHOML|nr:hypothetical protein RHMOL_Rhmol12G0218200 [Rhododendron molle]